jgi:hypothetical protein
VQGVQGVLGIQRRARTRMGRGLVICEVGRLAVALYLIANKRDSKRSVNKSNHPIQKPVVISHGTPDT